jgi:hypothetical protein
VPWLRIEGLQGDNSLSTFCLLYEFGWVSCTSNECMNNDQCTATFYKRTNIRDILYSAATSCPLCCSMHLHNRYSVLIWDSRECVTVLIPDLFISGKPSISATVGPKLVLLYQDL